MGSSSDTQVRIIGAISRRSLLSRTLGAGCVVILSTYVLIWLPEFAYARLATSASVLGINFAEVVICVGSIAIFTGLQIIFRRTWVGDIATLVNGAAQVLYIYLVTNGGHLAYELNGFNFTIGFGTILYLLILPSILVAASGFVNLVARASVKP
jgi:hypothetical protein